LIGLSQVGRTDSTALQVIGSLSVFRCPHLPTEPSGTGGSSRASLRTLHRWSIVSSPREPRRPRQCLTSMKSPQPHPASWKAKRDPQCGMTWEPPGDSMWADICLLSPSVSEDCSGWKHSPLVSHTHAAVLVDDDWVSSRDSASPDHPVEGRGETSVIAPLGRSERISPHLSVSASTEIRCPMMIVAIVNQWRHGSSGALMLNLGPVRSSPVAFDPTDALRYGADATEIFQNLEPHLSPDLSCQGKLFSPPTWL
jgi:hypothetical protein